MTRRPLIVLTLEGLAASSLSCYGSSWNATPAMDAIAATGCVWDRWIATDDEPLAMLKQWMMPDDAASQWTEPWREQGSVELITDDQRLIQQGIDARFDRTLLVDPSQADESSDPASDIAETHFGRLVADTIKRDHQGTWSVLWLHSRFLTRRWDAPRDLLGVDVEETMQTPSEEIELLGDPGDERAAEVAAPPAIFDTVAPPQFKLPDRPHPDLITSWMRTYGCQIRLVDLLIEVLLDSLQAEDPQVVLAGASGLSLGQNGWIGHHAGPLRSCDLRLPMVVSDLGPIRWPHVTASDQLPGILRTLAGDQAALVSPAHWCQPIDDFVPAISSTSRRASKAITTPRWFFVRDPDLSDHLFLKPDDGEDANDVGRLRNDVLDSIVASDEGSQSNIH